MRSVLRVGWRSLGVAAFVVTLGTVGLAACVADAPPIIGTATAGNGEVTVSWSPPVVSEAIVAYLVTPHPVGAPSMPRVRFDSLATTQTVPGLTNGVTYTFTVQAVNSLGHRSGASEESNPVTPVAPPAPVAVATGTAHTCAVLNVGTVHCWGDNQYGQLGNGTTTDSTTPVTVTGVTTAIAVAAAAGHTCVLLADGAMQCWGTNLRGQLGNGTNTDSTTPVTVTGITTATAISVADTYTCAVLADGTAACWGTGHLGNATTGISTTPLPVTGITNATSISLGTGGGLGHSCALLADGTVQCWGINYFGQLGNGTTTDSATPVSVLDITTATAITTGYWHTCALLASGLVECWGWNDDRQLGGGAPYHPSWPEEWNMSPEPVPLQGVPFFGFVAVGVDAGGARACVDMSSDTVRCWGNGSHQPTLSEGWIGASQLAVGATHMCGVFTTGVVKCKGSNNQGQVGNGTTTDVPGLPVTVIL